MNKPNKITILELTEILKVTAPVYKRLSRELLEFARGVEEARDRQWENSGKSFGEMHPANPNAKCKCEHWQICQDCHPTVFKGATALSDTGVAKQTGALFEGVLKISKWRGVLDE